MSITRRDLLKVGLTFSVAGCAHMGGVREIAGKRASFDWTLRAPAEAGMSASGLDSIRASIQKYVDTNQITGAVTAIARHNKLVWFGAQGVRDPKTGEAMRKDDLFRMMSSTKPVTATAVLMMIDEGKLALDDKVSRFIPSFKSQMVAIAPAGGATDASQLTIVPAEREITIKDLLTHTSGLISSGIGIAPGPASLVNKFQYGPEDRLTDYVPELGSAVLDFQPGSRWGYSGEAGMDVLLRIVEITSGQAADVFLRERLFEPLDMRDTYFNVPPEKQDRVLMLYARKNDQWQVEKTHFAPGPTRYISGAGGLFSTAHDFLQFELMLLNRGELNGRRVLRAETVELMSRNHVGRLFAEWIPPITGGAGFGLGVAVVEDESRANGRGAGAFGWGGAYGTETWADPKLEVAACLMLQQPVTTVKDDFRRALRGAIVEDKSKGEET
jgi:CubicO group peptidase (beta-lactamase class C family)